MSETNPYFPSGEWEGFYNYGPGTPKGDMKFMLNFSNGKITGGGSDPVGPFSWKGQYNVKDMTCQMVKYYRSHTVNYQGHVDENGIWGNWAIPPFDSGGFHIWPKKSAQQKQAKAVEAKQLNKKTLVRS